MGLRPAVIVHGLDDARAAVEAGLPVTLLSAPGAGLFAGCLWWRNLVSGARATNPGVEVVDVLDCACASGAALGALRSGVYRLVLWPDAPGWHAVSQIAERHGGFVLAEPPPALDLAQDGARRRLLAWLQGE